MSKTINQNRFPFFKKNSKSLLVMSVILTIAFMSCSKDDDENTVSNLALGDVSVFAGSNEGEAGFANGTGTEALFYGPFGLAVDSQGNVYVADRANNKIRKITTNATVSTVAGSTEGFADGNAANAQFGYPTGVAVDSQGNTYVADINNDKIRKITPNGTVSTFAGSTEGFADGNGINAQFDDPVGIAIDPQDNIYVSDSENQKIRKISPSGEVTTLAENNDDENIYLFAEPIGITVDAQGNVYVTDIGLNQILKITPNGEVNTLAGSEEGESGDVDGAGTEARFDEPFGIAVDSQGNLYVADTENLKIKKITPSGVVTTLIGEDNIDIGFPWGITVDSQNNTVYVADGELHRIIKIIQN